MILTLPSKNTMIFISIVFASFAIRLFFIGHHDLLAEEAYYWNYAMHLDWGYLDHPLMVALLIKLSTTLFGLNEFGVRCPALLCWGITLYYSYQWSELIRRGCGIYAILLLSILPFFFLYSLIITPDMPLIACWSGALYYLYRALCGEQKRAWYYAAIAIGLGLLSKYTMVLVIASTGLYVLTIPSARIWLRKKEPYIALGIIGLLFTPVIYWNITHNWISFAFQSTRRFKGEFHFSLHELIGLLGCFLTPVGIVGFYKLLRGRACQHTSLPLTSIRMFQYFTGLPLVVFLTFSITRDIKCNWIGPSLLGLIPWLALLIQLHTRTLQRWYQTGSLLLIGYAGILYCITFGQPTLLNQKLFSKMISWQTLTAQIYTIAAEVTATQHEQPILIPLDSYSIASELTFYQTKQLQQNTQHPSFSVYGADPLGYNSLMFQYWYPYSHLQNKLVILISKTPDALRPQPYITPITKIHKIWGVSQRMHTRVREYYYQVARMSFEGGQSGAM